MFEVSKKTILHQCRPNGRSNRADTNPACRATFQQYAMLPVTCATYLTLTCVDTPRSKPLPPSSPSCPLRDLDSLRASRDQSGPAYIRRRLHPNISWAVQLCSCCSQDLHQRVLQYRYAWNASWPLLICVWLIPLPRSSIRRLWRWNPRCQRFQAYARQSSIFQRNRRRWAQQEEIPDQWQCRGCAYLPECRRLYNPSSSDAEAGHMTTLGPATFLRQNGFGRGVQEFT